MTDDEFKTYLYMMGTRGTAFWELYYSPEMIDEGQKWDINAEYLEWAKKNYQHFEKCETDRYDTG